MFNRSFHNLCIESMILGATLLPSTSAYAEDRNLVAVTQINIPTAVGCANAGIAKRVLDPNQTSRFGDNFSETTIAQTPEIPAINSDASVQNTNSMSQVTSVSQFSDVGSADIWYYALGLAFPDLGKQGNLGGVLVGAEPYRGGNPAPANDLSLHIEGFYKYQLTDNIAITPGVIWITAPAQNDDNEDAVIGTVRTTFTF